MLFRSNIAQKSSLGRYDFINDFIKRKKLRIVLDAACGEGYGTRILSKCNIKVYAIDKNIEIIQENHRKNIYYKRMDCTKLEYPRNFFDMVSSVDTIEHVTKYQRFISEIYRVLKPGKYAIITTPNKRFREELFGIYYKKSNKFHMKEFCTKELENLLRKKFREVTVFIQHEIIKKPKILGVLTSLRYVLIPAQITRKKDTTTGFTNIYLCKK